MKRPSVQQLVSRPLAVSAALCVTTIALEIGDALVACSRSPGALDRGSMFAAVALGVSFGAVVACMLALIANAALRSLARAPSLAPWLALGLGLLAVVVGLRAIDLRRIDWHAIDPWLAGAAVLGVLGFAGVLRVSLPRAEPRAWVLSAGTLGLFMIGVLVWMAASPLSISRALAAIDDGSALLAPLVRRTTRALDRDHDGHPSSLCGQACDCDDARASVHPLAAELPGNGVDEDCDGHDTSARDAARLRAALAPQAGASAEPASIARYARPPDVLLIVIDTLRADHLGAYGYARETSPNIDALAETAVVFEQARSTGPSTRFSMPAMLTSKWFTEIDRNNYEWPAISQKEVLLGERLRDVGYTLAAFHSIRYFREYFHLGQGFDHWSERALDERGPELRMISSDFITDEALAWLDATYPTPAARFAPERKPLFLWAYYGDPHAEYMRHEGVPSFGSSYADRYDEEIAFTDLHVGRLLAGLKARGLTDDLVVILTSDHGEALDTKRDHGALNHSKHLYDELVHVPLLIAGPELSHRRVRTPVSLLDVLPTLLDLANAPLDPALRGVSLLPWLHGGERAHPPLFFEKHRAVDDPQKGMLAWPYKVIVTVPTGRMQIYDVASDPRETRDVYATLPAAERARLTGMLRHWAGSVLKPARDNWLH